MRVWLLLDHVDRWCYGVFSSEAAAIAWARKSRRFLGDGGGPIVPESDGYLNEMFFLHEEEIDPEPLTRAPGGATAGV
jgi:hypothetical protein